MRANLRPFAQKEVPGVEAGITTALTNIIANT